MPGTKSLNEEQLPRDQREAKPSWIGKWENAISEKQLDNVQEETLVASVMRKHPETVAARDKKNRRALPHQKRRHSLTKSYPQKIQATEERPLLEQEAEFRAEISSKETNSSCYYWHPPVCQNCKSETGYAYGKKCRFRHVFAEERPNNMSKKSGGNGPVALLKESTQLGCVSRDSHPRNSILWEDGQL